MTVVVAGFSGSVLTAALASYGTVLETVVKKIVFCNSGLLPLNADEVPLAAIEKSLLASTYIGLASRSPKLSSWVALTMKTREKYNAKAMSGYDAPFPNALYKAGPRALLGNQVIPLALFADSLFVRLYELFTFVRRMPLVSSAISGGHASRESLSAGKAWLTSWITARPDAVRIPDAVNYASRVMVLCGARDVLNSEVSETFGKFCHERPVYIYNSGGCESLFMVACQTE